MTVNAEGGPHRVSALAAEQRAAAADGVEVVTRAVAAATAADGLIRAAARADLLVVGCDGLGRVPKAVLRRAPCSVLLSRRSPDLPFLDTILVAADASPGVRATAAHLAWEHGCELRQVRAENITAVAGAIGSGLIVVGDDGHAADVARLAPCSVLVVRRHDWRAWPHRHAARYEQ